MDKTSQPRIPATTRGANSAARAAAALPRKGAKKDTRAAQESMRPEMSMIDSMRRYEMIAEAAYYRALARGFSPGCELQDWLQAEQEIDMRLM